MGFMPGSWIRDTAWPEGLIGFSVDGRERVDSALPPP